MTLDITLDLLLDRIKAEADRCRQLDPVCSPTDAYQSALVIVFEQTCEARHLSPFELAVLDAMHGLGGDLLKKRDISNRLELLGMTVDEWTLWNTLSILEEKLQIHRPRGKHSKFWSLIKTA